MTPRRYNLGKRAQAAEDTRRRIIESTLELHNEKGVVATSMQDIASRADVALHTVYRYFPTIDDVVAGCGQHVMALLDPPTPGVFAGVDDLSSRVRIMITQLFTMYERGARQIEVARCQQHDVPALARAVAAWSEHQQILVREALRPLRPTASVRQMLGALSDFYVWKAFRDRGISTQRAAATIADAALAQLSSATVQKGHGS
jgi:AcrR family transcriptional regulator